MTVAPSAPSPPAVVPGDAPPGTHAESAEGEWGEVGPGPREGTLPRVGLPGVGAARAMPEQLLQPGETIILLLKPSPLFIVLSPLRFLIIVALITMAASWLNNLVPVLRPTDVWLLGVAIAGGRLFWELLEWLSRLYILTDQRIIRTAGVIRISIFEAPLRRVQHTELIFPLRERLFALGTLGFSTAGTGSMEAYWRMVARPLEVHRQVVQAIRKYGR